MGYMKVSYLTTKRSTVKSINIARPLTLHTSPIYYAAFNQIKYVLIFNNMMLLEREKQQRYSLYDFSAEEWWISAKIGKRC